MTQTHYMEVVYSVDCLEANRNNSGANLFASSTDSLLNRAQENIFGETTLPQVDFSSNFFNAPSMGSRRSVKGWVYLG